MSDSPSPLPPLPPLRPAEPPPESPPGPVAALTPGWATTEFWVTIGTLAATFVTFGGILYHTPPEAMQVWQTNVAVMIASLGAFVGAAWTVYAYATSRAAVKATYVRAIFDAARDPQATAAGPLRKTVHV